MTWKITNSDVSQPELLNMESIFALGNGYLGVRGNFEEGYGEQMTSIRGTYLNAFHDVIEVPYGEKLFAFPETQQKLVNNIDAQTVLIYFGEEEEPFRLDQGTFTNFQRTLHMDQGFSERSVHWTSPSGKEVRLTFRRLVSFTHRELFAIHLKLEPINFSGPVKIVSTLNGNVKNYTNPNDPRVGAGHAERMTVVDNGMRGESSYVVDETMVSKMRAACVTRHQLTADAAITLDTKPGEIVYTAKFALNDTVEFTKFNVYTDTLRHGEGFLEQAFDLHERLSNLSFSDLLAEQTAYLNDYWKSADVIIQNDDQLQEGIRFNLYQLLQSAGRDKYSNIAAKGLSGEGYEGHYFWDTEIYMFPVFLMTQPELARQLLLYRYSILDDARARAREMGHRKGALFPWRTISGTECSSFFPSGTAQYHISADIAYSYVQYYLATQDRDFLLNYGAEVLIETARLWAEIGHEYNGAFHIDEVTGPDEYTCCVNNNYYTNAMAKHNLKCAAKSCAILKDYDPAGYQALCEKLGVTDDEIAAWEAAAAAMFLPYDEALGINPQDDTFLRKAVWDFANTPKENYPLLLHYHPLTIYRYQVCKQADTVLAHFLLEDEQSLETIRRSYDYYERITTHDSSLSSCIFSIMAAKIGNLDKAYEYFIETARLDLDNTHGNTKDGLHLANMGGTWMSIVYGFAGMRLKESGLSLAPAIPRDWEQYAFRLTFRDRLISVRIGKEDVNLELIEGEAIDIQLYGETVTLDRDRAVSRPLATLELQI
ncbi:glycosyl hydrolase family 65 protein [Paenibacillus barengoltzii]|uniref:glycoside hydrolase family 65 protein n=1 Tax=Paenibacillus barengoltzii TaxID=343517 RepID=UPI002DB7CAEA|nr:glycosyl hydrolase family 65 protein [Paenibacillus barengoltzii]MEC2346179.1 glycosyl hydrolase family 65 protein [Paenibacillus barengoltzii]